MRLSFSTVRFPRAAALALLALLVLGVAALAQQPTDPLYSKAVKLENEKKWDDALRAYEDLAKNAKDPAVAANAQYQAGLYAAERYGKGDAAKEKAGKEQAITVWRQLGDSHPEQAAQLLGKDGEGRYTRLVTLTREVDRLSSGDWKYKIIDALVAFTGRQPAFSYALALVLIAVLVKLLLWPLTAKQYMAMREMQRMQPHLKKIQEKYKGAELSQKQMELYKEHGVNPFASCLPTIAQLPFLFGVYAAIREYQYRLAEGKFLWIGSSLSHQFPAYVARDLGAPDYILLIVYTITNYVTMRLTPATDPAQAQQQKSMALMSSAVFFYMFIMWKLPSGFLLYWLALNALSIWQQYEYVIKPQKGETQRGELALETGPAGNGSGNGKSGNNGAARVKDTATAGSAPNPPRVRPRKKNKR